MSQLGLEIISVSADLRGGTGDDIRMVICLQFPRCYFLCPEFLFYAAIPHSAHIEVISRVDMLRSKSKTTLAMCANALLFETLKAFKIKSF
ncbi:uncharacterized protein [Physcomitrium patens]|uniref:uncharacterized protein isoform X2 n=1 Tax=Physcomitrium patens TaxID=3218 RepID=UPI003CCCEA06